VGSGISTMSVVAGRTGIGPDHRGFTLLCRFCYGWRCKSVYLLQVLG
jgi:hypothetical protein